jgi:hypothetical protein
MLHGKLDKIGTYIVQWNTQFIINVELSIVQSINSSIRPADMDIQT